MLSTITLTNPSDYHTHLRGFLGDSTDPQSARPDAIFRSVCALQEPFAQVLAMPNVLLNHIKNIEDVERYGKMLAQAIPEEHAVRPLLTVSLKPETTAETIRQCAGETAAVKYYPGGVTTNSGNASGDLDPSDPRIAEVFREMMTRGIVLSLHPETTVSHDAHGRIMKGFVHRAEREFASLAERIAAMYPNLSVVIEHISTREMAELVGSGKYPNLWGSVTPQHLLLTAHDKEGGHAFEPHLHCKPTLKDPEDMEAIRKLVFSGHDKVFFGSDSAPHPQDAKECAHCASGVFSSPIALQIITEWFTSDTTRSWWESCGNGPVSDEETVARLQKFVGTNGQALYEKQTGYDKSVTLERIPFTIPEAYETDLPWLRIVPMFAGKTIGWNIKEIRVIKE